VGAVVADQKLARFERLESPGLGRRIVDALKRVIIAGELRAIRSGASRRLGGSRGGADGQNGRW
jgi:hypothetical protein